MSEAVTTNTARGKIAQAHYEGKTIPQIIEAGWGEGGVDENGSVITPSPTLTVVPEEFTRTPVVERSVDLSAVYVSFTLVLDGSQGHDGRELSSCGLYDEEGDLVAVINFSIKDIEEDTLIELIWKEEF